MQAIKTETSGSEIKWAFAGTANAAKFDYIFGDNIQLVARGDDLAGNRVMSTTLAQGAGVSAVV
jgi:hypothetical protein